MIIRTKYITYALLLLLLASCDVIKKDDYLIDFLPTVPEGADIQRFVLEDYTGVRCNNCPLAAEKAAQLKESYGERMIVVAVHAGHFARPLDKNDFRTPAGEEYNTHWKLSSYPQGVVNRLPFAGEQYFSFDKWPTVVEAVRLKAPIGLTAQTLYDASTRTFDISVDISAYNPESLPTAAHLLLWLVEDNIIGGQIMPDKTTNRTYLHRHVLRGALNGTWGEPLTALPELGDTSTEVRTGYSLPEGYNADNCSVVVLLTHPTTKEVFQAVEVALLPPAE